MITDTNVATLIIAIMAMIVLIAFRFINNRLKQAHVPIPFYSCGQGKWKIKKVKLSIPLPAPLIVVKNSRQKKTTSFNIKKIIINK